MTELVCRWPCQCCRRRTLDAPSPGSYATCPVCYWTDVELAPLASREALFQARARYAVVGASSDDWLGDVRAPGPDEVEADDGLVEVAASPRDVAAAAARAEIARAFAAVGPEGRDTLRAAYRADNYGHETEFEWDDRDTRWQELPAEVVDFFAATSSVFIYGNVASFRYYLPAFMCRAIETGDDTQVVFALDRRLAPGQSPVELPEVAALDGAQRAAVVTFLRVVIDFHGRDKWAARALERIWLPALAEHSVAAGAADRGIA